MMRRPLLALMLLAVALRAHGQGSPEEAAIAELLTAKDAASVEKHLPKALSDALDSTDKATREELLSRPRSIMKRKGLKIAQSDDGRGLLAFDVEIPDAEIKHFELIAQRRISNGAEAVLVIACVSPERTWGESQVWMRYEDGEWRVTEFTDPTNFGTVQLDDPEVIKELAPTPRYKNEMNAIGGVSQIMRGVFRYGMTYGPRYPSGGPQRMEMLGGASDGAPSSEHAGFIDSDLASTHVRSGYRFAYEKTSIDTYTITASPLEFGKTGTRNFFADESGVLRFTTEDRQATANDPPVEERRRY